MLTEISGFKVTLDITFIVNYTTVHTWWHWWATDFSNRNLCPAIKACGKCGRYEAQRTIMCRLDSGQKKELTISLRQQQKPNNEINITRTLHSHSYHIQPRNTSEYIKELPCDCDTEVNTDKLQSFQYHIPGIDCRHTCA